MAAYISSKSIENSAQKERVWCAWFFCFVLSFFVCLFCFVLLCFVSFGVGVVFGFVLSCFAFVCVLFPVCLLGLVFVLFCFLAKAP